VKIGQLVRIKNLPHLKKSKTNNKTFKIIEPHERFDRTKIKNGDISFDRPHNVFFDCYVALVVDLPKLHNSITGIQFFKTIYKDDFGNLQPSELIDPEVYYVYAMDLIPIDTIRKFETLKSYDVIKVIASDIIYQVLSIEENIKKNSLVANPVSDKIVRVISSKTMKIDNLKAWQNFILLSEVESKEQEKLDNHKQNNDID
jgi:hypothetical protein